MADCQWCIFGMACNINKTLLITPLNFSGNRNDLVIFIHCVVVLLTEQKQNDVLSLEISIEILVSGFETLMSPGIVKMIYYFYLYKSNNLYIIMLPF